MPKTPDRQKFIELVEPRTSQVLDRLDVLGKLARPKDYDYKDADIDAIEAAIVGKVNEVMGAFRNPTTAHAAPGWTLPTATGHASAPVGKDVKPPASQPEKRAS